MKKQLLEESQIRRMMKFANIGSLSDGFVGRLNEQDEMEAPEEGDEMDLGGDMPPDLGGEEGEEPDLGGEGGGEDEVLDAVADLVDSVKDFVRKASKEPAVADMISAEREDGGEAEMAPPEEDEEEGMPAEDPMEEGMYEEDMEEDLMEVEVVDDEKVSEEMMNEVARRVARRVRLMKERMEML